MTEIQTIAHMQAVAGLYIGLGLVLTFAGFLGAVIAAKETDDLRWLWLLVLCVISFPFFFLGDYKSREAAMLERAYNRSLEHRADTTLRIGIAKPEEPANGD